MIIPNFDTEVLINLLLDQSWHKECQIITNWMPWYPNPNTNPIVVVKFPNQFEDVFLRYSCGPSQGYFWDVYGDDFMRVEIAILALSKAPVPLNFRKLESHVKFNLK